MCGMHLCLPPERWCRKIDICVERNQYKKINSVYSTFTCYLSQICVVAEQDHMQGIKCMLLLIALLQKPPRTKKASLSLQL